jgi:hypothetical protein
MEIMQMHNPVLAAKKLQDLAQSYGCKENISVLVIELFFGENGHDGYNDLGRTAHDTFHLSTVIESNDEIPLLPHQDSLTRQKPKQNMSPKVKPLPQGKFVKKGTPMEWENCLQERLSKKVKHYEVQSSVNEVMGASSPSLVGQFEESEDDDDDPNWSSSDRRKGRIYTKKTDNYVGPKYIQVNGELVGSADSVGVVEGVGIQADLTSPQRGLYRTNSDDRTGSADDVIVVDDVDSFCSDSLTSLNIGDSASNLTVTTYRESNFSCSRVSENTPDKTKLLVPPSTGDPDNTTSPSLSRSGSTGSHGKAHCVKYQVSGNTSSDDDTKFDKIKMLTEAVFSDDICRPEKLGEGQSSSSSSTSTLEAETGETLAASKSSLPSRGNRNTGSSSTISYTEPAYASIDELNLNAELVNPHSSTSTLVNMSLDSLNDISNSQVIKIEGDLEGLSTTKEPIYAVVNKQHKKGTGGDRVTLVILPRSPAPLPRRPEFEVQELTFLIRDDASETSSVGTTPYLIRADLNSELLNRSVSLSSVKSMNGKLNRSSSSVDVMTYL